MLEAVLYIRAVAAAMHHQFVGVYVVEMYITNVCFEKVLKL
jgi:hypothetical protein